jgi:hypothetical protein
MLGENRAPWVVVGDRGSAVAVGGWVSSRKRRERWGDQ